MKILQLCKKFPYPLKDGESIAVTTLSKSLAALGCEIDLLVMNTSKHYFEMSEWPSTFSHYSAATAVDVDNRIKPYEAFLNLFSPDSYHVSRFVTLDFENKLKEILQRKSFDIIQLETPLLAPYIPTIKQYSKAKIVMRAHNVEYEIWERYANNTKFLPKKIYLQYLTKKLKRFELEQLQNYDSLLAITQKDLNTFNKFGYNNHSCIVPIGVPVEQYQPDDSSFKKPLSLSFIGSLDWMPNLEGLQWFIEEVMPALRREFPDLILHVAGRNTPKKLMTTNYPNVKVHGEVPDAQAFVNQHSVSIVPLFSGSGMRAKILEAMALGKAVVTTELGVEGITAIPNKEVLIANTAEEFITQIKMCYLGKEQVKRIGKSARNFIESEYEYLSIASRLVKHYQLIADKQPIVQSKKISRSL